jgi:hypothetical protein
VLVPSVLLLEDGNSCDVFDPVEVTESVVRVRTAFQFEVGEELKLRIDDGASSREVVARVRGHAGSPEGRVTELEVTT